MTFTERKNTVRKPGLEWDKILSSFGVMMSLESLYMNRVLSRKWGC